MHDPKKPEGKEPGTFRRYPLRSSLSLPQVAEELALPIEWLRKLMRRLGKQVPWEVTGKQGGKKLYGPEAVEMIRREAARARGRRGGAERNDVEEGGLKESRKLGRVGGVRAAKRRLNRIMRQVAVLLEEVEELEAGLPAPSPEEWQKMRRDPKGVSYEVFFLGLVGMIEFHLAEAVVTLWEGYSDWRPAQFPQRIVDVHLILEKVGFIVERERRS